MDKIISPIKQRLFQFLEYEGIKKETFYLKTGLHSSNFKGVGAKSELGGDKLAKILLVYENLNASWLLTGNGRMHKLLEVTNEKVETELKTNSTIVKERNYIGYGKVVECVSCNTKDKFIELLENENKAIKEVNELLKEKISNYKNLENTTVPIDIDPKKSKRGEFYTPEEAHL